jgi:hypothetical protein
LLNLNLKMLKLQLYMIEFQTHYTVDRVSGSLCYVQTVFRFNWLTAHPSFEVTAAVEGGK